MKKALFAALFALGVFQFPVSGFAHERRAVGDHEFVVGFLNEPAFSGQMNGIDLRVSKGSEPVEGLETALKVNVRYGAEAGMLELPLKKRYKQPGAYAGYFLPARPGKYSFEVFGTIGDKQVREVFEPGEKFHEVADAELVKWPKT